MFIGTVLNWWLFGILIVQTGIFFIAFPNDSRLKIFVCTIFVFELIQTLSNFRDTVRIFGFQWGDLDVLDEVGWAWFSTPTMGSIISAVGQLFYAGRLYSLTGKEVYIPALIALLSFAQLSAGIWTGVKICMAGKFSLLQSDNVVPTVTWLAATSVCDLLIVCATMFYLFDARRDPDLFRKTNELLTRLIVITAEAGVPSAIFAIVDLILFVKFKQTNYHLAFCIELSKITSNCILLILNWRAHIGKRSAPADAHLNSTVRLDTVQGIVFANNSRSSRTTTSLPGFPRPELRHEERDSRVSTADQI
ncbi:hypothetical protein FB45DRAFT_3977 [Roridomyces roridus]|uniref:DUF6534 domain-containing protein n=1 Tax=Roridomyces roridus TaxID=1738132 RepID=A0AAD7G1X4_9AGAR|nr:hypothetical protein FB45DRAFT_3977 [Roridomyces roridus]